MRTSKASKVSATLPPRDLLQALRFRPFAALSASDLINQPERYTLLIYTINEVADGPNANLSDREGTQGFEGNGCASRPQPKRDDPGRPGQFLLAFKVVPVDEELAKQGGLLRRKYHASHGIGLADALIAATALGIGAELVTFNRRHYPMIEEVSIPYVR